jgi:hypothetical protein
MNVRDGALEVCAYGVTARGEKVCQDHFFMKDAQHLITIFQLMRVRNMDIVRIVLDIALPVVEDGT